MTLVPLENATWGFASNCFVCEPGNADGLGVAIGAVTADDARFVAR